MPSPRLKPNPEILLTPAQVAGRLSKSVYAVRKMIVRGQIPGAVKLGREWRVKESVFTQFIDELPEY